ncbi:MAG: AI-2E family transporter, partial [Anaerolineae bacterium]|nr:AI-2E family transporter [Anaerolineae bacterium]
LVGSLANLAIILMLSLYWSFYRQALERQWIALLPVRQRDRVRTIWRDLEDGVGGYIRSEAAQSVLGGLLLGIGYALMGLSFPALIALIGALLWLIPWLGAGLALVLPLLAGLYTGPLLAIVAPLYTIAVLAFLELVIQPRMFDRRPYSSLLIVILLIPLAEAYGLLGLLFAPPLGAAIQTLYTSLRRPAPSVMSQDLALEVKALHEQVKSAQAQIAGKEAASSPVVSSLLDRLASLTEQSALLIEQDDALAGQEETALVQDGMTP